MVYIIFTFQLISTSACRMGMRGLVLIIWMENWSALAASSRPIDSLLPSRM